MVRDFSPLAILGTAVKVFVLIRSEFSPEKSLFLWWLTLVLLNLPQIPSWGDLSSKPLWIPVGSKEMTWVLWQWRLQVSHVLSGNVWEQSQSRGCSSGERRCMCSSLPCFHSAFSCLFIFLFSLLLTMNSASLDGLCATPLSVELRF